MVKPKTIDSFFKKKNIGTSESSTPPLVSDSTSVLEQRPHKSLRIETKEVFATSLERDPGLRPLMWDYPINQRDEIRRIYITEAGDTVLCKIIEDGSTYSQRGEACVAYDLLTSFEFVFILHLLKEIMEITDILCQALQQKSPDIVNVMHLVAGTKTLIQNLRENGWEKLLETTRKFCNKHDIEIPEMSAQFTMSRALNLVRSRRQQAHVTVEHHFHVDVFIATIDSQLQELNIRFNEHAVELIILSSALNPDDGYRSFDCDKICNLVEKFYPLDFTKQEKILLKCQLQHYQFDVINHPDMQNLCTIAGLCRKLVETGKSEIYYLIDRLLRLVLTLPVSTATTERAFSAMKIIKTRLRSKIEDDFLTNCLVVYIEQVIAEKISVDKIIDDFYDMKKRRAQLRQ
ncbi:Dimer_Tnp_hAT domain-containing protein [Cephalotus follicularis]|uniref:Dimer_Tnp_hAT domain-containing protein n=1 Tax=Cephalotus follicularis TaxID=3775 RepID=A0A1Q3CYQ7_CEPFO|nr:Dimer_Tnp_hAT domain-containing protein [Cephalotus follicularis]